MTDSIKFIFKIVEFKRVSKWPQSIMGVIQDKRLNLFKIRSLGYIINWIISDRSRIKNGLIKHFELLIIKNDPEGTATSS